MNILLLNVCEPDPNFALTLQNELDAEKIFCIIDDQRLIKSTLNPKFIINISDVDSEPHPNLSWKIEMDLSLYKKVHKSIFVKYAQQYSRMHPDSSLFDAENAFRIQCAFFNDFYIKNKISHFIAACDFSRGCDLLSYHIAKELKITTLLMLNDVGDRFFHVFDLEDYGTYKTSVNAFDGISKVEINRDNKRYHPIFDTANPKFDKALPSTLKKMINPIKLIYGDLKGYEYLLKKITLIKEFEWLDEFRKSFRSKTSLEEIKNKSRKYIYFPLHVQPEASSTTRCDIFEDQTLVAEELSRLFPNHTILVKDNFNQENMRRRPKAFYKRLSRLNNLWQVDPGINSFELINLCEFVATINGTSGWESLVHLKPVLTFGKPFYLSAPNVMHIDNFDYYSFLDLICESRKSTWDNDLKKWIAEVSKTMGNGNVIPLNQSFPNIFNGYRPNENDTKSNSKLVSESIRLILLNKKV